MIARVADNCFWLGRYLERTASSARLLSVTHNMALDATVTALQCWRPVLAVAGEDVPFDELYGAAMSSDGEVVQRHMSLERKSGVSLASSTAAARENARSIREVLSIEVWRALNEHYLWLTSPQAEVDFNDNRYGFFRRVQEAVELVLGLMDSTMLHDDALDFIKLGLYLERASQSARILDVQYETFLTLPDRARPEMQVVETALLLNLLRACCAFEPFMKRYQGNVTAKAVTAFLLGSARLPRSMRFAVEHARDKLDKVTAAPDGIGNSPVGAGSLARALALEGWLKDQTALIEAGPERVVGLHETLTHVVEESHGICDDVGRELFGYK